MFLFLSFDICEFCESKIAGEYLTYFRDPWAANPTEYFVDHKWHSMMIEKYDPAPNEYNDLRD